MGNVTYPHVIIGSGLSVPEREIRNDHFESYLDTSDEWIRERTGIVSRRWADEDTTASELAEPAARTAIESAGLGASDIDAVIVATVTPDYVFPSTACVLQKKLGINRCLAFDVNAVCTGFIYALNMAHLFLATGQCANALVIGVDLYSRLIDKNDRSTCVLFGDGAGAVVLSREENEDGRGVLASELSADGNIGEILMCEEHVVMAGREVFKLAVRNLCEVSESVLEKADVSVDDVNWFVSHQANKRILLSMAKQLGVSKERVLINIDKYGNTSAASVPILIAESVAAGKIKKGDLVLVSAFGGGVTWGAILIRW